MLEKDWVQKWATFTPRSPVAQEVESGRGLNYGELNTLATRLASHLQFEHGLSPGDRIAVVAENCLEYITLFSAAQKIGFVIVPLNYRYTSRELSDLIHDAKPKIVYFQSAFKTTLEQIVWEKFQPELISFEELHEVKPALDQRYEVREIPDDHPIFILYTSGTTGFPKGAIYTHEMLFWNSVNTALSLIINSESKTVNCMPLFHTGGWNVLLTPLLHRGGCILLMKNFDATSLLELLDKEDISIFMGVPTMLKRLAELPNFSQAKFRELLYVIVGGEAMPLPLIETWHDKKVPVRQGYGMTEAGPNLTSLHHNDALDKIGSIGRPNFYVKTKVVREDGTPCGANEDGELLLKGPMCFPGYWNNPKATKAAFTDGWLKTGDIVKQDSQGYLYVVDRKKNMFISGGENVYPLEVERFLNNHPLVSESAILGVPSARWGEVGRAFLQLTDSSSESLDELKTYCLQGLAKFKIPAHWTLLDEIPKTSTGKIDRHALKNNVNEYS